MKNFVYFIAILMVVSLSLFVKAETNSAKGTVISINLNYSRILNDGSTEWLRPSVFTNLSRLPEAVMATDTNARILCNKIKQGSELVNYDYSITTRFTELFIANFIDSDNIELFGPIGTGDAKYISSLTCK